MESSNNAVSTGLARTVARSDQGLGRFIAEHQAVWRSLKQGGKIGREAFNLLRDQAVCRSKLSNGNRGREQSDTSKQQINVRIACTASTCSFARFGETLAKQHVEQILRLSRGVRERHGIKRSSGRNQVVETAWIATGPCQQSGDLVVRRVRYAPPYEGTHFRVSEQWNCERTVRGIPSCQREPFRPARCDEANTVDRIDADAAHEKVCER
ncbi:hypothetical protein RHOFW510R12_14820 [Rhodanobacter sp. FW510-R12]